MIEQGVNGTQPLFITNEGKVVSLEDDFMCLTRRCTIKELQDNNEEGSFIIFGTIRGIVKDGSWWYSACVCEKGIYPQNRAYYCDFCVKHITNVTLRFKIKITLEDHSGEGIFVLFDREASYLFKKSCADLFFELICRDTYPYIFQGLIGKKLLLKVDTKGVGLDKFYGTFRVRREPELNKFVLRRNGDIGIKKESSRTFTKSEKVAAESFGILCKSPSLLDFLAEKQPDIFGWTEVAALVNHESEKTEKTLENDTLSDDLSAELDILLSSLAKETQEVFSQVLDASSEYGERVNHEDHVVTFKGKRNLNPQFDETANDPDGHRSKIADIALVTGPRRPRVRVTQHFLYHVCASSTLSRCSCSFQFAGSRQAR
ncbi:uncharacterized protein DS421_2g46360 [Arachis hypogaea]|nr:uncharacterized protein DS421_2g46360 [Arachis hypogaea]